MALNLPPPIALRSFEVAARHLSFTQAAMELNVTQAAVSHQIKVLERDLGVPLFVRMTRKLRLTQAGHALYSVVGESFRQIAETSERLRKGMEDSILNVSMTPYFSAKWLTVRLSRFWAQYPHIDLRLHHSPQPGDFQNPEIDIAISWGQDDWKSMDSKLLLRTRALPVCSPKLITRDRPLETIDDLGHHELLHENDYSMWTLWFKRAGVEDVLLEHGTTMDDSNVILQAAIDGQGVALGSDLLLTDEFASGRLVCPFDQELSMPYSYYIVYKHGTLDRPKIRAFYDWLLIEADRSP